MQNEMSVLFVVQDGIALAFIYNDGGAMLAAFEARDEPFLDDVLQLIAASLGRPVPTGLRALLLDEMRHGHAHRLQLRYPLKAA